MSHWHEMTVQFSAWIMPSTLRVEVIPLKFLCVAIRAGKQTGSSVTCSAVVGPLKHAAISAGSFIRTVLLTAANSPCMCVYLKPAHMFFIRRRHCCCCGCEVEREGWSGGIRAVTLSETQPKVELKAFCGSKDAAADHPLRFHSRVHQGRCFYSHSYSSGGFYQKLEQVVKFSKQQLQPKEFIIGHISRWKARLGCTYKHKCSLTSYTSFTGTR